MGPRRQLARAVLGVTLRLAPLMALWACTAPPTTQETPFDWDDTTRPSQDLTIPTLALANDDAWLDAALPMLRRAQRHLEVSEFLLVGGARVDLVLQAIAAAADRGVTCRVLADETNPTTLDALDWLQARGCDARVDSPRRTTHTKLLLADDEALLGSHNFTDNALGLNVEASLHLRDHAAVPDLQRAFEELWIHSEAPQLLDATWVDDVRVLSHAEVFDALLSCLDTATDRVDAMIYAVAWDPSYPDSEVDQLLTAVEAAHTRGVQVRFIVDGSPWSLQEGIDDRALARLTTAGMAPRRSPSHTVHHAKVLRCDTHVIVGDANWSYSGLALYNGLSVAVQDPTIVQGYADWLDALWQSSAP